MYDCDVMVSFQLFTANPHKMETVTDIQSVTEYINCHLEMQPVT